MNRGYYSTNHISLNIKGVYNQHLFNFNILGNISYCNNFRKVKCYGYCIKYY